MSWVGATLVARTLGTCKTPCDAKKGTSGALRNISVTLQNCRKPCSGAERFATDVPSASCAIAQLERPKMAFKSVLKRKCHLTYIVSSPDVFFHFWCHFLEKRLRTLYYVMVWRVMTINYSGETCFTINPLAKYSPFRVDPVKKYCQHNGMLFSMIKKTSMPSEGA